MKQNIMLDLIKQRQCGKKTGIYSACTANELVIEAVLERGIDTNSPVLIEATANQVNQFGGYTGMKPADFVTFVRQIAEKTHFPLDNLILGGDHLGPLTWQNLPEQEAMQNADVLIKDYVAAGFSKIHLDCSMLVADDDKTVRLSDEIIASRTARLMAISEKTAAENGLPLPVYCIGSEVPIPGGSQEEEDSVSVTKPEKFKESMETFKRVLGNAGLTNAIERIVGFVVQPGVEFGDSSVTEYDRDNAKNLCMALSEYPSMVFEGHSTDYQTKYKLKEMVEDGIAILKVGPALTYALRQALFSLADVENEVLINTGVIVSDYKCVLENAMLTNSGNWKKYYHGTPLDQKIKRKYSFSDRCRYYLPNDEVCEAQKRLTENIDTHEIPLSVLEQYMPLQYAKIRNGTIRFTADEILKDRVKDYIDDYLFATGYISL